MKIIGIFVQSIEEAGFHLTLSLDVARNEELDGSEWQKICGAAAVQLECFKEAVGANGDDPAGIDHAAVQEAQAAAEAPKRRGRQPAAGNAASAGLKSEGAAGATTQATAGGEAASPTTRRRGRQPGTAAAPAPASPAPASSTASASEAPATGRRKRGEAAAATTTKEWTDADMSKQASQAAAVITPASVTAIMEKFDDAEGYVVENVHQIKAGDRQSFIDLLNEEMKKQS